jgi:hypothetical protein
MAQPASLTDLQLLNTDPQAQALSRQQQTADLLLQNSQQQPTGQIISGHYVAPSWAQQLNPLFNAVAGSYLNYNADKQRQELANALRQKQTQEVSDIMGNIKSNPQQALQGALNAQTPQAQALVAPLLANVIPKETEMEREYHLAKEGGFTGSFNDYKNQITPYQKAELSLRGAELNKSQVVETPNGVVLVNPRTGATSPVMVNGQPIMGKNLQTESQAKATVFHNQMESASNELNRIQGEGFNPNNPSSQAQINMAGGIANFITPSAAKNFKQAQNQWTEAYLRFKTGAGTNAHEIEANRQTYFPVFGDDPSTIAQKARMRQQAENDIAVATGRVNPMQQNIMTKPVVSTQQPQQPQQNATPSLWGKATVVGQ